MTQDNICPTHGHKLTYALDNAENMVRINRALRERQAYFCPAKNCGTRLYPRRATKEMARGLKRIAHYAAFPGTGPETEETYSGPRRKSLSQLVTAAIAENFQETGDCCVLTDATYLSRVNSKGEGWFKYKEFPVDLFARREGKDGIDAIIHILELPLKCSANELYQKVREIAIEPQKGRKETYIVAQDGTRIPLSEKVYQNLFIVKNDSSFSEERGDRAELPPTAHTFVRALTDKIYYFNPQSMTLHATTISDPETVEGTSEENPNRIFTVSSEEMVFFGLDKRDIGPIRRTLRNRDDEMWFNITNMKIAEPLEVIVDDDGNPVSVKTKGGQLRMFGS